jgi:glycosyltransferase involved in cell wall biosynthesis
VALTKVFQFMFRLYFHRVWYYANLLISVFESHPQAKSVKLFVPAGKISPTFGVLARREVEAVIDCARLLGLSRGLMVELLPLSITGGSFRDWGGGYLFAAKRKLFSGFLKAWNLMMVIFQPSRHPRLLISDYWKNVGSSLQRLKTGEFVFLDRGEIFNIGWQTLFRYRIRFVHLVDFISRAARRRVEEKKSALVKLWGRLRANLPEIFICRGQTLDPLLVRAFDDIVNNLGQTLGEIEGAQALCKKIRPDLLILRASVSAQTHFSILPLLAQQLGLPAFELQHGLEYLGPGSLSRDHTAEYVGVYGALVKKELVALGYAADKVREIGSPRFDGYGFKAGRVIQKETNNRALSVLCIAPDIRPFEIYDSYSAQDYFRAVAEALRSLRDRDLGISLIIKLRPGPAGEQQLRSIIKDSFQGLSYTIAQQEPLLDLYAKSDIVISGYSTAILEALQCGVPVILTALNPIEAIMARFHFQRYDEAGALELVFTAKEILSILAKYVKRPKAVAVAQARARSFLEKNFCFDGRASERFAALIGELVGPHSLSD